MAKHLSSYWKSPGAFNNGVVGTVSVFLSAGFSFQGTEVGKCVTFVLKSSSHHFY